VISLGFIRIPFQTARDVTSERRSLRAEMGDGLRFLWRQRRLRLLALLTMAVNFLQAPIILVVIVLAQNTLRIDVRTLGLIVSAGGAGGLLGALLAPRIARRVRFGHIIVGGIALWGLAAATLALAGSPPLLMLGLALVELLWPLYAVTVVTYRLSLVPDTMQGRINSAFRLLTFGTEPLGTALGGVLLTPLGPRAVLWGIAGGLMLTALVAGMTELRRV
jgi:predicted MFS family arabinose efflux permease